MSFIQEHIISIDLGLSKTYHFIQINDVHVVTYSQDIDDYMAIEKALNQEKVWMKQRLDFAHKFKESFDPKYMLPSTECLNQLIDYSNQNNPDLVLLSGDLVDYYSLSNLDYLEKSLKKLRKPYIFSCGNHESPSELFVNICQGNCDFGYVDLNEFIVVSMDNSKRQIKPSQFEALKKIHDLNKPIILMMHIPIMTRHNEDFFSKLDDYYSMKYNASDETTTNFIHYISSSSQIKAMFCGHIHGAITSFIAPSTPQYCCSSGLIGHVNKIIIK